MNEKITTYGKIVFDPPEYTDKHISQSEWKKIAIIELRDESTLYYAWLFSRRYNVDLNPIPRGPHITLINDSFKDLSQNGKLTKEEVEENWKRLKKKWNGKKIEVKLFLDPRTDNKHWWFNVPHEDREQILAIRAEIGLAKPFHGPHMSFGYVHPHSQTHSNYIHMILKHEKDINHISKRYFSNILKKRIKKKTK